MKLLKLEFWLKFNCVYGVLWISFVLWVWWWVNVVLWVLIFNVIIYVVLCFVFYYFFFDVFILFFLEYCWFGEFFFGCFKRNWVIFELLVWFIFLFLLIGFFLNIKCCFCVFGGVVCLLYYCLIMFVIGIKFIFFFGL